MTASPMLAERIKRHQSKAGYWFDENDPLWQLDKNVAVHAGQVRDLFCNEAKDGFTSTLSHYARTRSSNHTANMANRVQNILQTVGSSSIDVATLISFRATLTRTTEHHLGSARGFIYKWYDLGHRGITNDVIDLLTGWTLKGNIKGDAVKRLDPTQGPLTPNELLAFNEGAVRGFEKDLITLDELSMSLLISNTGRRSIQITHTNIGDLIGNLKNKKGEPMYLIRIPRAKQPSEEFRESFKTFAMTRELWVILNAQRKHSIKLTERTLGYALQEKDSLALPLFPDLTAFENATSLTQLRLLLQTDQLHLKSEAVTKTLRRVASAAKIHSERTGKRLKVTARRFRYTAGTRAASLGLTVPTKSSMQTCSPSESTS